jgi:hypothetical protein
MTGTMEVPPNQALPRTAHKATPPLSFRMGPLLDSIGNNEMNAENAATQEVSGQYCLSSEGV